MVVTSISSMKFIGNQSSEKKKKNVEIHERESNQRDDASRLLYYIFVSLWRAKDEWRLRIQAARDIVYERPNLIGRSHNTCLCMWSTKRNTRFILFFFSVPILYCDLIFGRFFEFSQLWKGTFIIPITLCTCWLYTQHELLKETISILNVEYFYRTFANNFCSNYKS